MSVAEIVDVDLEREPAIASEKAVAYVDTTGRVVVLACRALMVLTLALPVLGYLEDGLGGLLVGLLLGFFLFGGSFLVLEFVFFKPWIAWRHRRASRWLADILANGLDEPVSQTFRWRHPVPGALAVTTRGSLVVLDHSNRYAELWLSPMQITGISVEREATAVTSTENGGGLTLGGITSGGLFGAFNFGSSSKSTTRVVEDAFLEIRYQLACNGATETLVVPFGRDRRAAEALAATLQRL